MGIEPRTKQGTTLDCSAERTAGNDVAGLGKLGVSLHTTGRKSRQRWWDNLENTH